MRIAYFIGVAILAGVIFWPRSDDFHPNGITTGVGAIVCPDSVDARSEFHKGIQQDKQAHQIKQPQHNEDGSISLAYTEALVAVFKDKPNFAPYGCSELEGEVPVYIESEDTTGIATISAELPNGTLLHGITYAQEIQRQQ